MAIRSKKPVVAIAIELSDGEMVELRRVPYLFDTFLDAQGRVLRLTSVDPELHKSGRVNFRVGTASVMLARAMMDTFYPGWDAEDNVAVHHIDGDLSNNAIENLEIRKTIHPGRPATGIIRRTADALQLLERTKDPIASAREHKVPLGALMDACKDALPDLYDALTATHPSIARKREKDSRVISCFGLSESQEKEVREYNRKKARRVRDAFTGVPQDDDGGDSE